jgi:hypothetical protein
MNAPSLTQQELKSLVDYDPETGIFTWRSREERYFKTNSSYKTWNTRFAGKVAGMVMPRGYITVNLCGKKYAAHRLAFLWMTGSFPKNEVDHINHLAGDNRWDNLRAVTGLENMKNLKLSTKNTSGVLGVSWSKQKNKWRARIKLNKREKWLGYFTSIDEAAAARAAANDQYGYHPNHGKG